MKRSLIEVAVEPELKACTALDCRMFAAAGAADDDGDENLVACFFNYFSKLMIATHGKFRFSSKKVETFFELLD